MCGIPAAKHSERRCTLKLAGQRMRQVLADSDAAIQHENPLFAETAGRMFGYSESTKDQNMTRRKTKEWPGKQKTAAIMSMKVTTHRKQTFCMPDT